MEEVDFPGKGLYLWLPNRVRSGDPEEIAKLLSQAGIERLEVKVAQADSEYNAPKWSSLTWGRNVKPEWLYQLRRHWSGKVMGWTFNTGYDPQGEADQAVKQARELALDYYGMDAESVFEKHSDASERARIVCSEFKQQEPDIPLVWVSWPIWKNPYPDSPYFGYRWHAWDVARAAMQICDFGSPMVYWPKEGVWWAKFWLENSLQQWAELVTSKPLIPIGRLYTGDGGICTAEAIETFGRMVRDRALVGESWWEMRHGLKDPSWWSAISALRGWQPEEMPTVPVPAWRNNITAWARSVGYRGPYPELEEGG
jgi:hypothetical protein